MKVFLMHRNRDFDLEAVLPPNASNLIQDLELHTLFEAMSGGDAFLLGVSKLAVLSGLREPEAILYRQGIAADCLKEPNFLRELYAATVQAEECQKQVWSWSSGKYPEPTLRWAVEMLGLLVDLLKRLRRSADAYTAKVRSEGMVRFCRMLTQELNDAYLESIETHLRQLKFRDGLRMSAALGKGNQAKDYVLLKPPPGTKWTWFDRLVRWITSFLGMRRKEEFVYEIPDRDESGFRALEELRGQGIAPVASALAQSTDHILSFFRLLRIELGFYMACLNLRDRLTLKREMICFPEPSPMGLAMLSTRGLYDVCLSLTMGGPVVGNDIDGDHKTLIMITGANRGGKSTFLRSLGLARLMMQCGMFVAAESFRSNICDALFTHFKRGEDVQMQSGKFDEELKRMSGIVDQITPNSLILFNESFAATNEREGSEIASQIVRALLESGIKVCYVTHLFDLAQKLYGAKRADALFLRAERLADGRRTFRLIEDGPLPTSFGEDLYRRIFGTEVHPSPVKIQAVKSGHQEGPV